MATYQIGGMRRLDPLPQRGPHPAIKPRQKECRTSAATDHNCHSVPKSQ
jgi:hypothetical protein